MKEYTLITQFKNYTPTFYTFYNFYRKVWDVKEFVYFIGYETNEDLTFIINNYIKDYDYSKLIHIDIFKYDFLNNLKILNKTNNDGIKITYYVYKTISNENNMDNWNFIKDNLFSLYYKNLNYINKYFINVDDDEFLYSSDMVKLKNKIKNDGMVNFHFIEIYPSDKYDSL